MPIVVKDLSISHSDSRSNSSGTCPCVVVPSSKEEDDWILGNISSSLCISASLSQSTVLCSVTIIICAVGGADGIWNWVEDIGDSRGRGRDEDAVGDEGVDGARISRRRSSIVASETASASWGC
jgi:hypothetical protein